MTDSGIIIVMAYPETIVTVADEWYSPLLPYIGIGKKNYVRAGHAALTLINKETGGAEYHDFGRYITPEPHGRVRGRNTDHELDFPVHAIIEDDKIKNLNEILEFLATHPKYTHGEGKLIASVCNAVNYHKARSHISMMQQRDFIRYAAFIRDASNCARFVTDTLIASVTDGSIRKRLLRSKWFTPSTIGNVVIADTENNVYEISDRGEIGSFKSTIWKDNVKHFLDKLKDHMPSFEGTLHPKQNGVINGHAQWLGGIAAGAWFELFETDHSVHYRFRRISPNGNIDVEGIYIVEDHSFIYEDHYRFIHYSNCHFFHIEQNNVIYRFELIEKIN